MDIKKLEQRVREALAKLEERLAAFDDPAEDADVEALERDFKAAGEAHRSAVEALARAKKVEEARANAPVAPAEDEDETRSGGSPRLGIKREELTYAAHKRTTSYFLDLARVKHLGDSEAKGRLDAHAEEMRVEFDRREEQSRTLRDRALEKMLGDLPDAIAERVRAMGMVQEKRDLTRVDGAGGHFVPPIHLLDEYAEMPRGSRPFADACRNVPLPGGTDSINIPRITTGTSTAAQTADNAAVSETDIVDAVVTAPVRTIAGQQDLALQLLEQSPIAFDEVVFADLYADYNFRVEDQCYNGSGAAGQVLGIRNVAGIGTVAYTDATPTVPELYPKIASSLSTARAARKRPITNGWIAPRRFYWLTAALDANNRPFVVPDYAGPQNAPGVFAPATGQDVPVRLQGVSHQMTDAAPLTVGAGTEDTIIHTRNEDHILFEGDLRARVLMEVLSGTLTVRLQVYSYVAFTAGRFPSGTVEISGTGLIAPVF